MPTRWLDSLFTTPELAEVFSDRARLEGMLAFEAALARAQARLGTIPAAAAAPIATACRAADRFDLAALAAETRAAGNTAIPLVKALTRLVAASDAEAARWVHYGATSQDAMDTGLVLQLRTAVERILGDLGRVRAAAARLAQAHAATPLAGRTWLQHALPTTFGLKAAGWVDAVARDLARLAAWRERGLTVQLGGAVGTLAAFGDAGVATAAALAEELELGVPDVPWHALRDRLAEAATVLGLAVGTLGKIAGDIALLMQTEVAEAFEPAAPGRGGSSAMPQKRNPVAAAAVLAAAARVPGLVATMLAAMVQEHERGLGGWHAEWDTLPEIFLLAGGAAAHVAEVLEGLELDPARMRQNLEATGGQIYAGALAIALAPHLGAATARERVEQACRRAAAEGRHLREVVAADAELRALLPDAELDRLFDPARAVGPAAALVQRVLRRPT
jgi:3-carboxy-cis,cis-muconate cycloisomerase